jgi:hypothetical protein
MIALYLNKETDMSQYAKKDKKNRNAIVSGKKVCRVVTNIKAGWKWVDDLKEKINNNLEHVKSL